MDVDYRCPGHIQHDGARRARTVHADGCCARFALMSGERRALTGRVSHTAGPREQRTGPPPPDVLDVAGLAAVVAGLQRRAEEFPDETPAGATVWVQYGPEHTRAEVEALCELGRPYNLVVGLSRHPNPQEEPTP